MRTSECKSKAQPIMKPANIANALDDLLIVEIGSRISTSVCGSLLSQAGATVVFIEPANDKEGTAWKWWNRNLFAAGKETLTNNYGIAPISTHLQQLLSNADAILVSTDVD